MSLFFTAARAFVYMTGFVFAFGWLALQMRTFDGAFGVEMPSWVEGIGLSLLFLGALLGLTCVATFVLRGRGTPAPFDAPNEFVAVGPYRYVRNPMYIGGLMMLLGLALYERSVPMIVFSALWFLLAHCFVIFYEEPALTRRFGDSYRSYQTRVSRWLPTFGH